MEDKTPEQYREEANHRAGSMNRQRIRNKAYRQKRYDDGLCQRCKNKHMPEKVLCMRCTIGRRIFQRKYTQSEAYKPGTRGRAPKYFLPENNA